MNFSAGLFFSWGQGGEALYVAVAQTLTVLIVWAQQRLCYPFYCCWTAVGAVFYTTARVNASRFPAVGVGVMLPILLPLVLPFTLRLGETLPIFQRLV